jgi:hypothetical protein
MSQSEVAATHRLLHGNGVEGGEVVAQPGWCDDCRGVLIAAERAGHPLTLDERRRNVEPPTYRELRRRAGHPLPERDSLERSLKERTEYGG